MFKLIENLRTKSDRTKKQIAFLISFLFVGIILVIWFSVIFPDFRERQVKEDNASKYEASPISSFAETFSSGIRSLGDEFGKIKELMTASSTAQASSTTPTTE